MCRIFALPSVWTSPFRLGILPVFLSLSLFMGMILQNDSCHWSWQWEGWPQERCGVWWTIWVSLSVTRLFDTFHCKGALHAPQLPSRPAAFPFYQANEGLTLFFWWFTIMGTFTPRAILWSEHWANKQKIKLSCGFGIDTYMPMRRLPI